MDIRKTLSQFRLIRKRSSRLTKIVVCATIVVSVIALLVLHSATLDARAKTEADRQKAQQLEQENKQLEEKNDNLGTLEGIKDIAQDELGLVSPDTIIIQPEN